MSQGRLGLVRVRAKISIRVTSLYAQAFCSQLLTFYFQFCSAFGFVLAGHNNDECMHNS